MSGTGGGFSRETDYAYAVGRVRGLERRLLARADFARLLDAPTLDAAVSLLADTAYGPRLSLAPWREALRAEERAAQDALDELDGEGTLAALFRSRHDFHNLKVFLKAKRAGAVAEPALSDAGRVPRAAFERAFGEDAERLPEPLESARSRAEAAYERAATPVALDAAVDQVQARAFVDAFRSRGVPFLTAWLAIRSDAVNLQAAVRLKWAGEDPRILREYVLPGGTIAPERLREIEEEPIESVAARLAATPYGRVLDEGIAALRAGGGFARLASRFEALEAEHLARARWEPFGPEPVVAYVLLKEIEIRALRMVLIGKANGIEAERLRETLPSAYV